MSIIKDDPRPPASPMPQTSPACRQLAGQGWRQTGVGVLQASSVSSTLPALLLFRGGVAH